MANSVIVTLNGSTTLAGIRRVRMRRTLNAPAVATVELNNVGSARAFSVDRGDTIKIQASPRGPRSVVPTVFYGTVTDIETTSKAFVITALDSLGLLANEIILTNPSSISTQEDAATIMKEIVAESNYDLSLDEMIGQTRVVLSPGLDLVGQTRLGGLQTVLSLVNNIPTKFVVEGNRDSAGIKVFKLHELEDSAVTPYSAGTIPRTSAPLDLYPTMIERNEDEVDLVNLVTVKNTPLNIEVTEPTTVPSEPIHRLYEEGSVTDETQARLFARQIVQQQGRTKAQWDVEAQPERFDIMAGDIISFASVDGGLAGRQRVFDVRWSLSPSGSSMFLSVGRQAPDFVSAIRFAANLST